MPKQSFIDFRFDWVGRVGNFLRQRGINQQQIVAILNAETHARQRVEQIR